MKRNTKFDVYLKRSSVFIQRFFFLNKKMQEKIIRQIEVICTFQFDFVSGIFVRNLVVDKIVSKQTRLDTYKTNQ